MGNENVAIHDTKAVKMNMYVTSLTFVGGVTKNP